LGKCSTLPTFLYRCCFAQCLNAKSHSTQSGQLFILLLSLLSFPSPSHQNPQNSCGPQIVDKKEFKCRDRGFYFNAPTAKGSSPRRAP
uniref:Uncharacterized protein n=1 Tax=Canis lupus familiaris TaxID=9615 RepID=A0A8C0T019_CANLF